MTNTWALLAERLARQGLADRPASSAVGAAELTTAVQAQDPAASRLGLRARARGLTDEAVRRAIDVDRSLVRTWLMRATIHLVTAADLRWLLRLIAPSIERRHAARWQRLGLTPSVLDKTASALEELLADGPGTLREIRAGFAERGITFDSDDPQAAELHAVLHASTIGLTCRGPDRGRTNTYVLLDRWLPDSPRGPDGDDALAELTRRYFAAYSPATAADFTAWAGLPAGRAIGLIRDELTATDVDGRAGFRLGEATPAGGVRLLPAFDNYVIGYRHRAALLAAHLHPEVYQGGMIRPVVVRDGAVIGSWALDRRSGRIAVRPFVAFPAAVRKAVSAEVADIGRFLDTSLDVEIRPA